MQKRATKEVGRSRRRAGRADDPRHDRSLHPRRARPHARRGRGARKASGHPYRARRGVRPLSAAEKSRISAAAEDRRMRILAIALMCGAMLLFTGLDTSSKWLSLRLPIVEIVWARYLGATVIALLSARPWSRPAVLVSKSAGAAASALAAAAGLHGVRRDRAPQPATRGDRDDLLPHPDLRRAGGRPFARRARRRRADDRHRRRLYRRADRDPPRNQRLPAGRRDRGRRRCSATPAICLRPGSSPASTPRKRR